MGGPGSVHVVLVNVEHKTFGNRLNYSLLCSVTVPHNAVHFKSSLLQSEVKVTDEFLNILRHRKSEVGYTILMCVRALTAFPPKIVVSSFAFN